MRWVYVVNISRVWWPVRANINNICFWHFLKKKQKTFHKLKRFYFRFKNTFVRQIYSNKNIFDFKTFISYRKHFHFRLQIKIFSFQNQNQFHFCFENAFISEMFSKYKHFRFKENVFSFRKHFLRQIKKSHQLCGRGPCVPPYV